LRPIGKSRRFFRRKVSSGSSLST